MTRLLAIALGGALGASLRFGLITLASPLNEYAVHAGALTANLVGCFLIGLLWVWARRWAFSEKLTAFLFAGLLGSFTTFATYGMLNVELLLDAALIPAAGYFLASNTLGLALVYLGVRIGSRCFTSTTASTH